tara:strand:+ start:156 stop:308 length:153 start_codon:yes stop_codon:yes gene_type:complete
MKTIDTSIIILALKTLREQVEHGKDETNRRIRNNKIDRINNAIKTMLTYE